MAKNDDSPKPQPKPDAIPSNVVNDVVKTLEGIGEVGIHNIEKLTDDGLKTIRMTVKTS